VPTDEGRLDLDRLDAACDERTRIVSISWVGYATGYRHDLASVAEIAHRHGALLFVDAIQGLGAFPLDVSRTPIDFLAADGHKWQLGPEGAGVLFVRHEHLDRLRPWGVGWNSVAHSHDFTHIELNFKPSAERFEGGSQNMPGMLGLGASLALLERLGVGKIASQILDVTDLAVRRLEEAGARVVSHREGEHRSGIVALEFPGASPQAVRQHCLQRGVVLSCRGGRLRISPHAYNTAEEIEQAVEVMREAAGQQE
jgi:selenocysteine lyase/cysteine desulfurase